RAKGERRGAKKLFTTSPRWGILNIIGTNAMAEEVPRRSGGREGAPGSPGCERARPERAGNAAAGRTARSAGGRKWPHGAAPLQAGRLRGMPPRGRSEKSGVEPRRKNRPPLSFERRAGAFFVAEKGGTRHVQKPEGGAGLHHGSGPR